MHCSLWCGSSGTMCVQYSTSSKMEIFLRNVTANTRRSVREGECERIKKKRDRRRDRETKRGRGRETERESDTERDRVRVCV